MAELEQITNNILRGLVLTETKYGPAKSRITPAEVQMPICPMNGNNHLKQVGLKN